MKRYAFVGLVFALNLLLSNVCLLGTAYASTQDASSVEILSREVPMSFNVVTCTWVKTDDGWEPTPDSPCASGKCLKKQEPDTRCLFAEASAHVPAELPPSLAVEPSHVETPPAPAPSPVESPPPYPGLATTVLRM